MLFGLFGPKKASANRYSFERMIDGKPFTITVDLEHETSYLDRKTFQHVIVVAHVYKGTELERARIEEIAVDLVEALKGATKAALVGIIWGNDVAVTYIAAVARIDEAFIRTTLDRTHMPYTLTCAVDPGWVFLTATLYPTDAERQRTNTAAMVALTKREQGDNAATPTGVEHTIFFKSVEGGESFCKEVASAGYVRETIASVQDRDHPILFVISKKCLITIAEINSQTDYMIPIITRYQGRYQGWQATAVDSVQPAAFAAQQAPVSFEQVVPAHAVLQAETLPEAPAPTPFEQVTSAPIGMPQAQPVTPTTAPAPVDGKTAL